MTKDEKQALVRLSTQTKVRRVPQKQSSEGQPTLLGSVKLDVELADAVPICHLNLVVCHHAVVGDAQRSDTKVESNDMREVRNGSQRTVNAVQAQHK